MLQDHPMGRQARNKLGQFSDPTSRPPRYLINGILLAGRGSLFPQLSVSPLERARKPLFKPMRFWYTYTRSSLLQRSRTSCALLLSLDEGGLA